MSLLDDVRRLAETAPGCANGLCHVCGSPGALIWEPGPTRHALDCPWLALPRIIAALAAAERLIEEVGEPVAPPEDFGATEVPDRLLRALIAALNGVPAHS